MTEPLGPGTISLGLSAVGETGSAIVNRLTDDATAAVEAGFAGITLSEHHGGFPHYVPSPQMLAGVLLARLPRGWACAAPAILPLRTAVTVAEDLAWLEAAYPGRVGAGFVPGYQEADFTAVGVDFASRSEAFWAALETLTSALGKDTTPSPLKDDPAIAELGERSVPLVAGVSGAVGARRAARLGVGLLIMGLRPPEEAAKLVAVHRRAGNTGPIVLIRRVHVGTDVGGFAASMSHWAGRSDAPAWLTADDTSLITGSAEQIAERLVQAVQASGCSGLNLRLDTYTHDPSRVADQITALGAEVLPRVRDALGWPGPEL
jgi:alkanesulfonate monooxygenase SsuD/methylene tetrahydromethanopterin reductase-like flavin-dependent oxidoreductase (luciferase family)